MPTDLENLVGREGEASGFAGCEERGFFCEAYLQDNTPCAVFVGALLT